MTLKISSTNIQGSTLDVLTAPAAIANAAFAAANVASAAANTAAAAANVAAATATSALTAANTAVAAAANSAPRVSLISYPGDDTAANTGGGQTITLTGTGFASGATVLINGTYAGVVSVANSTSMSFAAPTQSAGTYTLYVINTDGGTAISIPGISYSGTPNWTTAAGSLGTSYETAAISSTLTATGDAPITYSLYSGTLPPGSSLNTSSGLLSGTSQGVASSTTYNFTIRATDAQNQDTDRAFSITLSPDVVTWSSPSDNSTTTAYEYAPISNVTMSATSAAGKSITYTANTLPTGVTITGNTISGTPTVVANTNTRLTANAANTFKTATKDINFVVNQDVVTWSSPADGTSTALFQNQAMSNVTLSATSAAGKSITYSANALPTGVTITGAVVNGTPTDAGTTNSLITATAATTNRTATRNFTWVVSVANDTFFKNTTLLLNGETTVTPFISDASTNSLGLTINGDTKPTPFTPCQGDGYYSNYFQGTNTKLTLNPSASELSFGTGDYTIEVWAYATTISDARCIFTTNPGSAYTHILRYSGTTAWELYFPGGSTTYSFTDASNANSGVNKWIHHAIVRSSGTLKWYINGVSVYSIANSTSVADTTLILGNYASYWWNGYISNFRAVKGVAVYTGNFTVPTTPLTTTQSSGTNISAITGTSTGILTAQSNRFIDKSTNATTVTLAGTPQISPAIPFTANASYSTYGSTYFDGTGDWLRAPYNSAFSFGTNSLTIECWLYHGSGLSNASVVGQGQTNGSAGQSLGLFLVSSGTIGWYAAASSGTYQVAITGSVPLNQWNHVAGTRNGSTWTLWINGVSAATTTWAGTLTQDATGSYGGMDIGHLAGIYPYTGYISNVRVTNGTALYTTTFTPPTTPLTTVANTQLLTLQYNGGATNSGIIDNSNFNNIITRAGNTSQGTFSPYSVTGWSNYFDGTGDYLETPSSSAFAFGTGSYTIEGWVYVNAMPAGGQVSQVFNFDDDAENLSINSNGTLNYWNGGTSTSSTTAISAGTWTHIAYTRSSSTIKAYINNVEVLSASSSGNYTSNRIFVFGARAAATRGNNCLNGYLSNVRVLKGTALTTFILTSPLTAIENTQLLTCQSNRLIDNSPNSFTLVKGGDVSVQAFDPFGSIPEAVPISYSNYFDGSGDYLYTSASSANAMGTGDYTVEAWIYVTAAFGTTGSGRGAIISNRGQASATNAFMLQHYNGKIYFGTSGTDVIVGSTTMVTNTWYHVVVSRSSGTVRLFLNGVSDATAVTGDSTNHSDTNAFYVGIDGAYVAYPFTGYISNARLVKGTAVYTSAFTPSTTPLTAIANTSLLTCQSTRMIDNSTNAFTITAAGDTKPRQFNPFGYTAQSATSYTPTTHGGSAYFDGTGDYLRYNNTSIMSFSGSSNFTVECWIYQTAYISTSGYMNTIIGDLTPTDATALYWCIGMNASNQPGIRWYDGTVKTADSGTALSLNVWNHVAWVVTSGVVTIYINGVKATLSGTTTLTSTSSVGYYITGADRGTYVTGYMSDLRITKSALYTSNFVPPTQTLGNYSTSVPSQLLLNFNNGGIIDQHGSNNHETVNNVQLSTAVKKYGNSSISFNGTNQQLTSYRVQNVQFGSGDWTVEFWAYFNSLAGSQVFANYGYDTSTTRSWILYITSGVMRIAQSTDGSANVDASLGTPSLTTGVWNHFAFVRNGGVITLYVNGVSTGTTATAYTLAALVTNYYFKIGGDTTNFFNGYMDDFRITKGVARYTTTFTPPTSALITK